MPKLLVATDAVARYDQVLKGMHNSTIFLAPMRSQEAVVSSRMEGTISTMDEILQYEASRVEEGKADASNTRSEAIETILYQIALTEAQQAVLSGQSISNSLDRWIRAVICIYK